MKNRHKYFRNLRHQQKLEAKSHGSRTYWSHTMFYTEEPDTRDIREDMSTILWVMARKCISMEDAIREHIEWYNRHTNGRFVYYERPEVPYTIHKVPTDPRYSRRRVDYKKYSNKLVRQAWKQRGEVYQHGRYKKLFGIAWEMD
jgi:hypothetical protein